MAVNDDARGWQVAFAVAGGIALLFTRDYTFVAPLVVAAALAAVVAIDPDAVYDTNAASLVILFMPWCLGTYNERTRAVAGLVVYEALGVYANYRFDASVVRRLLRDDQEKERDALEAVESTGRQALTEMRRLVGLLREQGTMPEFSPQPGMSTIDSLLDGVRAAGLPVELDVEGAPRELPPGVDLAAYRVVQEALTNALEYAGPAHAWVAVSWGDDELELTIANDGRGGSDGTGGGQGLDGMRERVSLYGGEIASRPREGGGFVVRARLPIGEPAS